MKTLFVLEEYNGETLIGVCIDNYDNLWVYHWADENLWMEFQLANATVVELIQSKIPLLDAYRMAYECKLGNQSIKFEDIPLEYLPEHNVTLNGER